MHLSDWSTLKSFADVCYYIDKANSSGLSDVTVFLKFGRYNSLTNTWSSIKEILLVNINVCNTFNNTIPDREEIKTYMHFLNTKTHIEAVNCKEGCVQLQTVTSWLLRQVWNIKRFHHLSKRFQMESNKTKLIVQLGFWINLFTTSD